ncbi:MAG: NAD kinase [Bacteroidia bacterium]
MKVAVYGRPIATDDLENFIARFTRCMETNGIEYLACASYGDFLEKEYGLKWDKTNNLDSDFDFLISLGGDGTVLDTLALVRDSGLPVLGVNLGRFGFLATIKVEDIDSAVQQLLNNEYEVEGRSVLEVVTEIPEIQKFPYALNDFVVQKRDSSAMISVDAYLEDDFLNSYWSDGLILATPTGSSGYSLSCGGPLLFPGSQSMVLTPIAAHNLTVRPAVLPDNRGLHFNISSRGNSVLVSLDSRSYKVPTNTKFEVKKADFKFNMVNLDGQTYMDTIRTKLMWGVDKRNSTNK